MKPGDLKGFGDPESVTEAVTARSVKKKARGGHGAGHVSEVVRTATHRGHRITVKTTYTIDVDGTPIAGHFGVTDDGQVHYHAVPNVSFDSAIDMVKKLIDAFPDDFPPCPDCDAVGHDAAHADHDHPHHDAGHGGGH